MKIKLNSKLKLFFVLISLLFFQSSLALPSYHNFSQIIPGQVAIDDSSSYGGDQYVFLRSFATAGSGSFFNIAVDNGTGLRAKTPTDGGIAIHGVSDYGDGFSGTSSATNGIYGKSTYAGTSNTSYGVKGEARSPNGKGMFIYSTASGTSNYGKGLYGITEGGTGKGIEGYADYPTGDNYGIYSISDAKGIGTTAVYGQADTRGVYGYSTNTSSGKGIWGDGYYGVYGYSTVSSGKGVYGYTADSTDSYAIHGYTSGGSDGAGVKGETNSHESGAYGIYVRSNNGQNTNPGVKVEGYEVIDGLTRGNCHNRIIGSGTSTFILNGRDYTEVPDSCINSNCYLVMYEYNSGNYNGIKMVTYFQEGFTSNNYASWRGPSNHNSGNNGVRNGLTTATIIMSTGNCDLYIDYNGVETSATRWTLESDTADDRCYLRVCS